MGLKEARAESERLRAYIDQGKDPKLEVLIEKQKFTAPKTLNNVFSEWYESYCKPKKKQHHQIKRVFENHILPTLGELPADRIDIRTWLNLFEPLAIKYKGTAKVLLSNTKQMLKWAVKREIIDTNALNDVFPKEDLNIVSIPSKRYLSDEELVTLMECLKWSRLDHKNKIFIELCLIYACRNGELRRAEKKHFDLKNKIWIVPPQNHKTGYKNDKTLIRPILPKMEELILEAFELSKGKYLFNHRGDEKEYMTDASSTALPMSVIGWVSPYFDQHDEDATSIRHEDVEVALSFYGNNGQKFAKLFIDGTAIPQNIDQLKLNKIKFIGVTDVITAPDLLNEQYVHRFDVTATFRRKTERTYAVQSFQGLSQIKIN